MGDIKTLQIRGTSINYADLRRDEVGTFTRVHCESDLTAAVANFFGWEILKDDDTVISGPKSMKMDDSELPVTAFLLEPNGFGGNNSLEIDAESVGDFSISRVKTDGGGTAVKLSFIIRTRSKAASAKIERFMETVGKGIGLLKLRYRKSAQAEIFDAVGETDDADGENDSSPGTVSSAVLASVNETDSKRSRKTN